MPAVNSELMHQSLVPVKGDYNQIVFWSGLINSKNQTLTPNPDVIYFNPLYDTRQGPVVLEIPPANGASSITGFQPGFHYTRTSEKQRRFGGSVFWREGSAGKRIQLDTHESHTGL
jgi:hypothetical protein